MPLWLPTEAELSRPLAPCVNDPETAHERGDAPPFDPWEWIDPLGKARVVFYKTGARVYFDGAKNAGTGGGRKKGALITDQSAESRRLSALMLGNANCDWCAMTTLTWRFPPTAEKMQLAVDRLRRKWKERWGEGVCAWVMEMQRRGVPHFHIFHAAQSATGAEILRAPTQTFPRNYSKGRLKSERTVVRGAFDKWIVGTWLDCTDQLGDASALAFARGGMCELMRSPDAAGRYVAAEIGKRYQKQLPKAYQKTGLGRWWFLNPRWEPRPISFGSLDLRFWPYDIPLSHIWEGIAISGCVVESEMADTKMPLKHWLRVMGFEAWPTIRPASGDALCSGASSAAEERALANLTGLHPSHPTPLSRQLEFLQLHKS